MSFDRTREAVAAYDAAGVCDNWPVSVMTSEERALTEAVGEAFADDTADRNARDTAKLVRPGPWLRGLLGRY